MAGKEERKKRVVRELEALTEKGIISGFSLALADQEKEDMVYRGVMGSVPPYAHRRIRAGLYYDLASLSKVVGTTSCVMKLAENGSLSLESQVQSLLPDFLWEGITVEHLLLHNGGLPAEIPDKKSLTRENMIERLYQVKPDNSPGERFVYSDVGFILLGLVIERVQRTNGCANLEESFKKLIFAPLDMFQTSYIVTGKEEWCVPTEVTEDRGVICGQVHDRKAWLLGQGGSAGLFSTLEDLTKFVQAYLRENPRLFARETFRRIFDTDVFGRTFGWSKEYGKDTLYHTGFTGTSILMDLKRKEGMILLTNRIHPSRENHIFLEERKRINRIWLDQL